MSAAEIKTELRQLIEKETDMKILEAIHTILSKTGLNSVLKAKLTARALNSDADIKAGRVFDKAQVILRTKR